MSKESIILSLKPAQDLEPFTKEDFREQIDTIMAEFNFEQVYDVMKVLEWKWACSGKMKTPSLKRIKSAAKEHMERLAEHALVSPNEEYFVSSGGFRAEYHPYAGICLYFVLEEYGGDWRNE